MEYKTVLDLNIPKRFKHAFYKADFVPTLRKLGRMSDAELMAYDGVGEECVKLIREEMKENYPHLT